LVKTFWTGVGGWADQQLPDGTVIWTSPTGTTYKTRPGSRIFFPDWDITTAPVPQRPTPVVQGRDRGLMMPKRRRTRAAERTRRILKSAHLTTPTSLTGTNRRRFSHRQPEVERVRGAHQTLHGVAPATPRANS
jgi:hypothetical protein